MISFLKSVTRRVLKHHINDVDYKILNADLSGNKKKVLISYLSPVLLDSISDSMHSNVYDWIEIINFFRRCDFEIHLIKCTTFNVEKYINKNKYEIVFGLGVAYYNACLIHTKSKKILYCTESSPRFSLSQESDRVNRFNEKYSKNVKITRSNIYITDEMINVSDVAIVIGNNHVVKTYDYCKDAVIIKSGIYPSAIINSNYQILKKSNSNKSFLWFGSTGVVHKGLDLAIEAVAKNPEFTLYVAGVSNREKNLMPKRDNVIYLGRINVNSDKFIQLINSVSAFIFPSCSEAGSTATTTCLSHGLIPIISVETGVDLPDNFNYIENSDINTIAQHMEAISLIQEQDLFNMHHQIMSYARNKFSILQYRRNLENILSPLI